MVKKLRLLVFCLCVLSFLLTGTTWAQVGGGEITGTVTDPSGAVMPGVTVTAINVETGVIYAPVTTNTVGVYSILDLPIGTYAVRFEARGFNTYNQSGITISMGQIVKLDVPLKIGTTAETVSVRANASPLDSQTATVATTLNSPAITDLPFSVAGGRDVSRIAFSIIPTVGGDTFNTSVANSVSVSKVVMVDGTDFDAGIQGFQQAPGMEAVQQFRVETSGISAESAGTGGGAFMYVLKSGTNQFHGSAFGFLHNEAFDANTWDNNYWLGYCNQPNNASSGQCAADYNRPRDRFHDFGFSAGGPVIIPKIYNGKDKTFIFGDFERYDQTDLRFLQDAATVPTAGMLAGNFSDLLDKSVSYGQDSAGNTIYRGAVFDPATQNVFVGNIIPSDRISPQAKKVVGLYQKYYAPNNSNIVNNFNAPFSGAPIYKQTNFDLKVDQNFSVKNHLSVSFNYSNQPVVSLGDSSTDLWVNGSSDPGPLNSAQEQQTFTKNLRGIDTYTISPNVVNVLSVAWNHWYKPELDPSPVDNQSLGFTAESGPLANNFPVIKFTGANGINEESIGNRFGYKYGYTQWHISDNVSWLKGRHDIKFGGQFITYAANNTGLQGEVTYNFSSATGVPTALESNSEISPYLGFGFANFLLGDVGSASKNTAIPLGGRGKGMDLFIEDQIKVTRRLTVNASLRWDTNYPWHEVNGHWSEFDLNATNPTWSPYVGTYRFLSNGSQSFWTNNDFHQFGPHVGAAYQFSRKLVARAAWGMFYVPLGINTWGAIPYQGTASFGYAGTNNAPNAGISLPAFNWDQNIYPGVEVAPVRDPTANQMQVWGPAYIDPNTLHLGRTENWNLGVQYEFGNSTVLDVSYVGNIGRNLHAGYLDPRNYPTWSKYKPLLVSGNAQATVTSQADAQAAGVPWLPFAVTENFIGGWSHGYYPAWAAISPYPQAAAGQGPILFADSPLGSSGYNGMVAELRKRAGNGLVADLNYTLSRATGNVNNAAYSGGNMMENWVIYSSYQDPWAYNSFANLVSGSDITNQVKGYVTYQLPLGHGKKWLAGSGRALNALVGGWEVGTLVGYNTGSPIAAVMASWIGYPGMSSAYANHNSGVPLSRSFKTLDLANLSDPSNLYFNPQGFSDPTYGNLGNQKPFSGNWRGWGYSNEDISILKRFNLCAEGRCQLTLRAEFFDAFNRHHWSSPDTYADNDPYFGAVTGVSGNRTGQVGARFQW